MPDIVPEDLVEMHIPIKKGGAVPADHRYVLYSCLKRQRPDLSKRMWSFAPLTGYRHGELIEFDRNADTELMVRVPVDDIAEIVQWASKPQEIGRHLIVFGQPRMRHVRPCPHLRADMVLVTGDDADHGHKGVDYGMHVGKRLGAMIGHLDFGVRIGERKRMQVRGNRLWGHTVDLWSLSPEESMRLQLYGIGERRQMGCGVFVHTYEHMTDEEREAYQA